MSQPYFSVAVLPPKPPLRMPAPQVYDKRPAPISSALLRSLDARKINANQQYGEAMAQTSALQSRAGTDRLTALRGLGRDTSVAYRDTGTAMGGLGQSLSPAAMGRAANNIAERQGEGQALIQRSYSDQMGQLAATLAAEKRERDAELAEYDRQKLAYAGANLNLLLPGVNY